jgi:lipoprotein-anchoring transpeptidase ErfK/SrfK
MTDFRPLKFALALVFALGFLLTELPSADAARYFDARSGKWVNYTPQTNKSRAGRKVPDKFSRRVVSYETDARRGSIIINSRKKFLYYVLGNDRAIRYGIGVGRFGFGWKGVVKIGRKATWPTWTPPKEMIARQPNLKKYAGGMPGGVKNPLGARSLYLFDGGRDTLYRIHGTNEPSSIGLNVSSGCIRLVNDDIVHLFKRAKVGATVIVR